PQAPGRAWGGSSNDAPAWSGTPGRPDRSSNGRRRNIATPSTSSMHGSRGSSSDDGRDAASDAGDGGEGAHAGEIPGGRIPALERLDLAPSPGIDRGAPADRLVRPLLAFPGAPPCRSGDVPGYLLLEEPRRAGIDPEAVRADRRPPSGEDRRSRVQ